MTILGVILGLIIIGAMLALVPIEQGIKTVIVVVVAIVVLLWLASATGILPAARIGHLW
jgi:hypothetical protein